MCVCVCVRRRPERVCKNRFGNEEARVGDEHASDEWVVGDSRTGNPIHWLLNSDVSALASLLNILYSDYV